MGWQTILKGSGPAVLSIAAIVVSLKSCHVSQQALDSSEDLFYIKERPYLTVTPIKQGSHFVRGEVVDEKTYRLHTRWNLANSGTMTAKDIELNVEIEAESETLIHLGQREILTPPIIDLPKDGETHADISFTWAQISGDADLNANIDTLRRKTVFSVEVSYRHPIRKWVEYKTTMKYDFRKGSASLLARKTDTITHDPD